ncbi:MAG: YihA family ribosome biogenesis GTP-binding protein [Clostridia bacterium]|nr:YihA family ribosome biogenesis GTP-binding protein [Clostridia bacterium]
MSVLEAVSFRKSIGGRRSQDLPLLPEIAFAGRSNAGKSSLINYLSGKKKLAYTGKQPGKTRLINYFDVDGMFYLVDLPGYGYAKASHAEMEKWGHMMDTFFSERGPLAGMVICMDIRRDPSPEDVQMAEWASYYGVPFVIAATKADKVAKSKRANETARIKRLIAPAAGGEKVPVVPVSSADRTGGEQLVAEVSRMLREAAET